LTFRWICAERLDHFRRRVCKYTILVVSRFHSRLKMPHLATLLAMSPAEAEQQLSELVAKGALAATAEQGSCA
jgi:hypothetical protein